MKPRCLYHPRVVMSESPDWVVIKTPLDHPETFFETRLDPQEAIDLARQLLNDADRALRMRETNEWLARKR